MMRRFAGAGLAVLMICMSVLGAVPAQADETGFTMSGRVVDGEGRGIRHIRIEVHRTDVDPEWYDGATLTDENGNWTLRGQAIPDRTFYLEAEDPFFQHEFRTTFFPNTTDRAAAQILTFENGTSYRFDLTLGSNFNGKPPRTHVDTSSMSAVGAAYRRDIQDLLDTPPVAPTTKQIQTCSPAATPAATSAMLRSYNFVRSMAQLDPVSFDPALSSRAGSRTLMSALNNVTLSEDVNRELRCWDGAVLAQTSGIIVTDGGAGARGVSAIIADHGVTPNWYSWYPPAVRLLDPSLMTVGAATTGRYTALDNTYAQIAGEGYPFVDGAGRSARALRTWPTPGFVPSPLTPQRWSVELNNWSYDLANATLAVERTGSAGGQSPLPIQLLHQSASNVVWQMPPIPSPAEGSSVDYLVRLGNVRYRGLIVPDISYPVRVFDPRLRIKAAKTPTISGAARVGATMTATATWTQPGVSTRYQWLRDGKPIPKANGRTLTLGTSDVGHRLSVAVTGVRPYYFRGAATSTATARVTKNLTRLQGSSTTPARGQVKITVTLAAAGEKGIAGIVTVTENKVVKSKITVRNGQGSVILKAVYRGNHTYILTYSGSDRLTPANLRLSARAS